MLEAELQVSRKDATESEKKLQALAEELRVRVLEEKVRAQKLARRNSKLAAERMSAAQHLSTFEWVPFHYSPFLALDPRGKSSYSIGVRSGSETISLS